MLPDDITTEVSEHTEVRVRNAWPVQSPPLVYHPAPPPNEKSLTQGSRGLSAMFGLHLAAATLTVIVDLMVFGGDVISGGMLIPVGLVVGSVLSFIVYRIQTQWYGDTHDAALTKALIVGLLTAIPVPLTPIIAIPGGLLGLVQTLRGKKS